MRSVDMLKVSLFAHSEERERILTTLHKEGILQLIDLKTSDLEIPQAAPTDDLKEIADTLLRISHCNSIIKIAPSKPGLLQNLFGLETMRKALVKRRTKPAILKESHAFLKAHEKELLALEEEHEQHTARLEEIGEHERLIETLKQHNLPPALLHDTEHLTIRTGRIANSNLGTLQSELKKEIPESFMETREHGTKESVVLVVALKEYAQRLSFLTKKNGVVLFAIPNVPDVKDPLAWIRKERKETAQQLEKTIKQIASFRKHLDESIYLREDLELLKERFEAITRMRASDQFFVLQGWVTKRELTTLRQIPGVVVHAEEPKPDENVPVQLRNPRWLRPYEVLTELYALPHYKDLDPTFIVGPLFLVYAGFMLTDFVYGFGLVILGLTLYFLFKQHNRGVADISISITGIGFFSMIFGVLTGSYLGDAPKYFFGLETAQIAIWKDPLADPLYFLIISLFVGLVHLNIGLILGLIEDIRKQQWKAMLSDRVVWWLLQLAVLGYVLNWGIFAHLLIGVTIILVIATQGPLGLLGMTGFMGDVISYSRLFALALSTAGIAMTVNLLADMLNGIPYVGFVLAALIFVIGHLFSFAMNALGSFVHSIRLQFVEFFGKFYEGGGDRFTPFAEERVYTEVDE